MLIVGSHALNRMHHNRKPNDLDIIVPHDRADEIAKSYGEVVKSDENVVIVKNSLQGRIEFLIARPGNAFWEYLKRYDAFEGDSNFIDAAGLFSLKKSHIHIPIKFEKHIHDYCLLNKMVGGRDAMPELTKHNTEDIKKRLGKHFKSPSLNKSVKEFFAQSEGKVMSWFVHDHIHEAMSHYERPLYEKMQKDLTMAKCEKELWEGFSYEDKMRCVLEEAYVIALERKIIPVLYGGAKEFFSPEKALKWSMMRVCTTLTGGWFRKFATENYPEIMSFADNGYVRKFLKSVDKGEIKTISPSNK
jgi:hypothetical protein